MISIGARGGSRSSSLELRPPAKIFGFSPRPLRLLALNRHRREGCGESPVLAVLPRIAHAAALRYGAISRLPSCRVTRHCVPSRFDANLLKTNDRRTCYPSLEKGGRPSLSPAHRRSIFQRSGQFSPSLQDFPFSNFHFPLSIPESRRSRSASDTLPGGII